ncbi:hypothetical protein SPRG_15662 [Saprolegnia parasitica CBS 223.65]|uniref:J domain-containing protein n=1 Tax=Saprolegnia parasitica (strain CBS 223.65) TaxID=695850 RepID=A0A067BLA1_SAPPC|nr:hypothetical protein SPRG_15662 [Saprolegnia parasitica CBS 223.65]KDO19219.1 hypothetical protein SPRG_15662 [Saprolegnia parasitica CBS 223.65]|eukprot:XP_012210085.1 hypothetical protein SPRG_15662 [Saprolegnia parasitica CBS 223.65]
MAVGAVVLAAIAGVWHTGLLEPYYHALLHGNAPDATYYEVLRIAPTASASEIAAAYRTLSREYHPDKTKSLSPAMRDAHTQAFYRVAAAYETLSHDDRRRDYDRQLHQVSKPPSMTWQSRVYLWWWQLWYSMSFETCGYIVCGLGLVTILCEYVLAPIQQRVFRYRYPPSNSDLQQPGSSLYEARLRLQAKYDADAQRHLHHRRATRVR